MSRSSTYYIPANGYYTIAFLKKGTNSLTVAGVNDLYSNIVPITNPNVTINSGLYFTITAASLFELPNRFPAGTNTIKTLSTSKIFIWFS
jgi:hypothetical protein